MRPHLPHDDNSVKGDEVTTNIVAEVVFGHLARHSPGCIVCTPAQPSGTNSCVFIPVNEHQDGNIAFEPMLLCWFPIARANDQPVKSSKRRLRRVRNFEKNESTNE